jgi:hypothetical protein
MNLPDSAARLVIVLVLIIGTTARLTRLVTADSITDPARAWISAAAKDKLGRRLWHKLDDLLQCPWCVSIYVGAGSAYIGIAHWDRYLVFGGMLALTASWATGNVQVREPDPMPEKAEAVSRLVEAGFTNESAVDAVETGDLMKLERMTE